MTAACTARERLHSSTGTFSAQQKGELEALIAAYEAEHPNVDIQLENFDYELYLQTLQTAMPAGEEADILQLFGTWTSQYYERLAPVPADVMTIEEAEKIFYAAPIGGYIVDGKLYGMPQEFNMEYGGVLVNKTMFEAAGIPFPPADLAAASLSSRMARLCWTPFAAKTATGPRSLWHRAQLLTTVLTSGRESGS